MSRPIRCDVCGHIDNGSRDFYELRHIPTKLLDELNHHHITIDVCASCQSPGEGEAFDQALLHYKNTLKQAKELTVFGGAGAGLRPTAESRGGVL